jgi:hypothetical protein
VQARPRRAASAGLRVEVCELRENPLAHMRDDADFRHIRMCNAAENREPENLS